MPNTSQAQKRDRQNEKRRLRNKSMKSAAKTYAKRVIAAVESGKVAEAEQELRMAFKRLDKAAKKHVMHRNTVARRKSKLAKLVHTMTTRVEQGETTVT